MSLFSVTPPLAPQERSAQHMDLQLLPDDELMDLWEQSQQAAWALEGKGWDAEGALRYGGVLVWEMQRRLAGRPVVQRFGSGGMHPEAPSEAESGRRAGARG